MAQEERARPSCRESAWGGTYYLADSSGFGVTAWVVSAGLLTSSVTPFMPSLKPLSPSPRPLPSSGSFLPPNRTRMTIARTIRCVGVKSSPIVILPAAGIYTRRPAPTIVAHERYGGREQADVGQ